MNFLKIIWESTMKPLWNRKTRMVWGEPGMFVGGGDVELLFPAEEVWRVYNPTTGDLFSPGRDFLHEPGSGRIVRTPSSLIASLPEMQLHPAPDSLLFPEPGANAIDGGVDGSPVFFDGRDRFNRMQILVDYRAASIDFPDILNAQSARLPRTGGILASGKGRIRITAIGDSITEGFHATLQAKIPPYAPRYLDQVATTLEEASGVKVDLHNRAVGGSGCKHALTIAERWLPDDADLLVIAYGMNDFWMEAGEFSQTIRSIMELARERRKETEFLLVSPMSGISSWTPTRPGRDNEFSSALAELAASHRGVALADVQSVWREVIRRKKFYDLTSNGVNHPNDYGHRLYAATVLSALIPGGRFF